MKLTFRKKPKDQEDIENTWELTYLMSSRCFLLKPICQECKDHGDLEKCPPWWAREQLKRWGLWSEAEYERRKNLHTHLVAKAL